MKTKRYKSNGIHLVKKAVLCCFIALFSSSIYAQELEANNANALCSPDFNPCNNVNVLDFSENGINWNDDDMSGTYNVGDQTFDINVNDPNGIFGALQDNPEDMDDIGSYENNTGLAIGINPDNSDEEIEITYNLSLVSDYVAFTIRDLDDKYKYGNSRQTERVCVYGYLDGVEVLPNITSLCGSVEVDGNCAVATNDSNQSGEDESIRIIFETCIDEIKVVYGNSGSAGQNPTYSKIYIGDDIGFGTAVCTDACTPCLAAPASISIVGGGTSTDICVNDSADEPVDVETTDAGDGEFSAWVITDTLGIIVDIPSDPPPYTLDGAGVGTCLIWYITWDGELSPAPAAGVDANTIIAESECVQLSNPVTVNREECCTAAPASISIVGGETSTDICVNDSADEPIEIQSTDGGSGEFFAWVITDSTGIILDLPSDPPPYTLDGAGVGTCLIWYLTWDGELSPAPAGGVDANAILAESDCAQLSNPITVNREECCTATNAVLNFDNGTDTNNVCVNDNEAPALVFDTSNLGTGEDNTWVLTDENGIVISTSDDPSTFDFYGAAEGTCIIWYVNWDGDLSEPLVVGADAGNIALTSTCAKLSNPLYVVRECCCPYTIQFDPSTLTCLVDAQGNGVFTPDPSFLVDSSLIVFGMGNVDDSLFCVNNEILLCGSEEPIVYLSDVDGNILPNSNGDTIQVNSISEAGYYVATIPSECGCGENQLLEITQEMLTECGDGGQLVGIQGPTICNGGIMAEAPIVKTVLNNSATVQWNVNLNANLEYKAADSNNWIKIFQTNGFVIIPNLGTCKEYEVRLNYNCENGGVSSMVQKFTTGGCVDCANINPELVPLNVTGTSAILTWNVVPGSVYQLHYRTDSNAEWSTYSTPVPFVVLFGLDECAAYEFGLKVTCSNARTTDMSSIVKFGEDCGGAKTSSLIINDNNLLNISPNPATSFIQVSLVDNSEITNIEVYNSNGTLIMNQKDLTFDGALYTADITDFAKGLYFVTATSADNIFTKKFIAE